MRFRRRLGRSHMYNLRIGKLLLLLLVVATAGWSIRSIAVSLSPADSRMVRDAVRQFYTLEQTGDFGSAWEMLHPDMQQKFNKARYIQTRNHVIMEHFGVDTFDFTLGKAESVGTWSMSYETPPLSSVYKIPVTQTFHGQTFGIFDLRQDVYAAKKDGEWRLLWAYP